MTPDENEIAEAALLIAHVSADKPLPRALERQVIADGVAIARAARFSTTKAAAVEVDGASDVDRTGRAPRWIWPAWIAAAACFSLVVYEWRSRSLDAPSTATAAPAALVAHDSTGRAAASLVVDALGRAMSIQVDSLPATAPSDRYDVWLSPSVSVGAGAVAVGSFRCDDSCDGRTFAVRDALDAGADPRVLLITRTGAAAAASFSSETLIATSDARATTQAASSTSVRPNGP